MNFNNPHCPLCFHSNGKNCFPWKMKFNNFIFEHLKCLNCNAVFIYPFPSTSILSIIYSKSNYHDIHYSTPNQLKYERAVELLSKFTDNTSKILDYGCGTGEFLSTLRRRGYDAKGVEFDTDVANMAMKNSGFEVFSIDQFLTTPNDLYNLIHIGDVLEHVDDPSKLLINLSSRLDTSGYLFIEGPLEENLSLVYISSKVFASLKRVFNKEKIGCGTPTHLWRVSERTQRDFFARALPEFEIVYWKVYECGWPYLESTGIKFYIAKLAIFLSGFKIFNLTFGNRFTAILKNR
jgi:SAM-dependent methyltransferase